MESKIKMEWVKSTKGTHFYSSDDPDTPVTTIYIKRSGLPTDAPGHVNLTIEYETENFSVD